MKPDTLAFFLIIGGNILDFAHWLWCWLLVSCIRPLLCWGMLLLFWRFWVFLYYKWVLYLIKCFFCIYWYDYVIFVFVFVYVMYYIYWFVNIVPSLHPWHDSHLIMVYDLFNVLLDVVYQYFVEDFIVHVYQQYWPVVFFL